MIDVRNVVGRLVEVRLSTPSTAEEFADLSARIATIVAQKRPIVTVVDLREAHDFPAELEEQVTGFLRQDNANVERTGLLVNTTADFGLRLERVLRESNNLSRRAFKDEGLVVSWLRPVLTPVELSRVELFFTR